MSIIRYINGEIYGARDEIDARVLTRPANTFSDGIGSTYCVDVTLGTGELLRNVPIAAGAREISYAEAGNPCRLRRSNDGRWEVIGFSKRAPGSYFRVLVDLADLTITATQNLGISARPLTYLELSTLGPAFGSTPWGATGIFRGPTLLEIR
jgi:hypothetical protein